MLRRPVLCSLLSLAFLGAVCAFALRVLPDGPEPAQAAGTNMDAMSIDMDPSMAPANVTTAETSCISAVDDDADGVMNDGCPRSGATAETGAQCANALNDDSPDDTRVNDGCTTVSVLGTFESCARINFNGVIDADEDPIDYDLVGGNDPDILELDVVAQGIPEANPMMAFSYTMLVRNSADTATVPGVLDFATASTVLLAQNAGSAPFEASDMVNTPGWSDDGNWLGSALDTGIAATRNEYGSGVLSRLSVRALAAGPAIYRLKLTSAFHFSPSSPPSYLPDGLNHGFVLVDMPCPTLIDLQVANAVTTSPALADVGVPFVVSTTADVNELSGGVGPVPADVAFTLNLPPDCMTVSPNPAVDPVSVPSLGSDTAGASWTVTCASPSFHSMSVTAAATVTGPVFVEGNAANNAANAANVVTAVTADADLKVTSVSVSASDGFENVAFDVSASIIVHNNGPDGQVPVPRTATLAAPADCTISGANPAQSTVSLGLSTSTAWSPSWSVECSNTGFHTFAVNASVMVLSHVNDPAAGNNSDSGVDTNLIAGPYPGEIHGTKWDDQDGDGYPRDVLEPGLAGVQICLFGPLTPPDDVGVLVGCTNSNGSGDYQFISLAPGYYRVAETTPSGRTQTYPANGQSHFVTVGSASITGVDFGNAPVPPGGVQGNKFNDVNQNGVKDGGETGVSGINICIHPAGQCTATNSNGDYSFTAVPAGSHTVYESLPFGSVNTTPAFVSVTVTSGGTVTGVDFGNRVPVPPPPEVTVSSGSSYGGIPVVFQNPTIYTKDVTGHCGAASPVPNGVKLVITFSSSGGTVSQMMTNTSGEIWSATMGPYGYAGSASLTFYVDCPPDTAGFPEDTALIAGEDEIQQGGNIYVDPSGTILDECTGGPLDGVTVTLVRESPPGSNNFVAPASAGHIPTTNPQTTAADGAYGWVVIPGAYKVRAEKAGYVTGESADLTIPPAVTDLNLTLASATDGDCDGVAAATDNCATVPNAGQQNLDGDALGDACDSDDDGDTVSDVDEAPCGTVGANPQLDPSHRPERIDGAFFGQDDDGDGSTDEALPAGAENFDCDGDGYTGSAEAAIYSPSTVGNQDPCGYDGWAPDFVSDDPASYNKINVLDLTTYITLGRKLNSTPGDGMYDARWDVVPGPAVPGGFWIDVLDLTQIVMLAPPMLGGERAFQGPECPWTP